MLFKPHHKSLIREGEKTATRREWAQRMARPGRVYMATTQDDLPEGTPPIFASHDDCDCYIRATDVYRQKLGAMTDEDARKEGDYHTVEEFIEGYEAVYGDGSWDPGKEIWVVEFEYIGREHNLGR